MKIECMWMWMWMREWTAKSNKMEIMLHRNECECVSAIWDHVNDDYSNCFSRPIGAFVECRYYGRGWCFSTALHKIMPPFSINTPSKFWASKHSFHIFVRLCVRLKSHTYCMVKKLNIDSDVTVYVECMLVLFVSLTCLIWLELDSLFLVLLTTFTTYMPTQSPHWIIIIK